MKYSNDKLLYGVKKSTKGYKIKLYIVLIKKKLSVLCFSIFVFYRFDGKFLAFLCPVTDNGSITHEILLNNKKYHKFENNFKNHPKNRITFKIP